MGEPSVERVAEILQGQENAIYWASERGGDFDFKGLARVAVLETLRAIREPTPEIKVVIWQRVTQALADGSDRALTELWHAAIDTLLETQSESPSK